MAAFGYTRLDEEFKFMIVGGTSGDMFSENTFELNLKQNKISACKIDSELNVAQNKVFYRFHANKIYSVGGFGSAGMN